MKSLPKVPKAAAIIKERVISKTTGVTSAEIVIRIDSFTYATMNPKAHLYLRIFQDGAGPTPRMYCTIPLPEASQSPPIIFIAAQ